MCTGNQRAVSDDASCGTLYAGCGAGQALQVAAAEVGTVRCTPATQPWMCRAWSARTPRQPAEPGPRHLPSAAAVEDRLQSHRAAAVWAATRRTTTPLCPGMRPYGDGAGREWCWLALTGSRRYRRCGLRAVGSDAWRRSDPEPGWHVARVEGRVLGGGTADDALGGLGFGVSGRRHRLHDRPRNIGYRDATPTTS